MEPQAIVEVTSPMSGVQATAEEIVMFQTSTNKSPIEQRASSNGNNRSSSHDNWTKHEEKDEDMGEINSPAQIQVDEPSVIPSEINNAKESLHATPAILNQNRIM